MPITYRVDQDRDLIEEIWSGEVGAADLERYWIGYLADPKVMACRRTLVDLRHANIKFDGKQLAGLVDAIAVPRIGDLKWKTAIVVGEPVQFGVARQYQVFAEVYSTDAIFEDYDAALSWLLRP